MATDPLVSAGVHRNRTRSPRPEEGLISLQVKEHAGSQPDDGEIVIGAVPAIETPVAKRIAIVCSSWYSIRTRVAANLAVSQSSATTSAMGWLLNVFFLSGRGDWRARAGRRWPW
jgi:hypothetical protein